MNLGLTESALAQVGAPEILDAVHYGAYITDSNRTILYWSYAAESITGWRASEVVGRRCSDHILAHVDKGAHDLCGRPQCPLYRALVAGEQRGQPILLFAQHKQGHRIPVEVTVNPLRNRTGQTVGAVEIFRDLTRTVEDLRRAKIVQDYILQWHLPTDPRVHFEVSYRPEEVVGGDFYRVQAISPDQYAIMVADVMGHGLISALYTVQVRSIWGECEADLSSPARFLEQLNRRLHKLASLEGYFATAICLTLDVSSGRLRYVRGGHPAPLLVRQDGAAEFLSQRSPAIGLLEKATYQESELWLAPGDQLVLYTDGAIEIANPQGQVLGESGLEQLLQSLPEPKIDLGQIERRLLEYAHCTTLPDDLTLLSVHFRSRGTENPIVVAGCKGTVNRGCA